MAEGLGWVEEEVESPEGERRAPAFNGSAANVISSIYPYTREVREKSVTTSFAHSQQKRKI